MTADFRALCEELLDEVAARPLLLDRDLVARARAALARPEPEAVGPTDEELLRMAAEAIDHYDRIGIGEYEAETECAIEAYGSELIAFARAVLARWGRPAPVPTGEVVELVRWLRMQGEAQKPGPNSLLSDRTKNERHAAGTKLARAADMLERQSAPVPVAVSERLPQPEDCDAEGMCWWWYPPVPEQNYGYWIYEDNAVPERSRLEWPDSWLPFNALPLPSGEVE